MIRNESSDLLREQKHCHYHYYREPKKRTTNKSSPNCTLFGAMLLPESETNRHNGKAQKPRTHRRRKRARSTGTESGGKSKWKTAANRRDRT
jgi:hypothetical protein